MSDADLQQRAEARLDELADELIARGLVEFHEFFMPHRQTDASPPLASEIYGIRWDEARALFVEKVDEQSAYLRGRS
jgi:hypothetical protein